MDSSLLLKINCSLVLVLSLVSSVVIEARFHSMPQPSTSLEQLESNFMGDLPELERQGELLSYCNDSDPQPENSARPIMIPSSNVRFSLQESHPSFDLPVTLTPTSAMNDTPAALQDPEVLAMVPAVSPDSPSTESIARRILFIRRKRRHHHSAAASIKPGRWVVLAAICSIFCTFIL